MRIVLVVLCVFPFFLVAQEIEKQEKYTAPDSVIVGDTSEVQIIYSKTDYKWGIYARLSRAFTPNPETYQFSESIGAGFELGNWFVEGNVYSYVGNYVFPLIFPNEYQIQYINAGGNLGYRVKHDRYFDVYISLGLYHGDMIWENSLTFEDLFRDKYWISKIDIRGDLTPIKFARLFFSVGYQRMSDLQLTSLSNSDFSGFTGSIGLKIGFYKMEKIELK